MKKRLLLIRHAQSQANAQGVIQGWLDSPLSDAGHYHAQCLGTRLATEFEVAKIFVSPLSRAVETAAHLGQALKAPVTYYGCLKERNLGPLTGLTKQEVRQKYPQVERAWVNNLPRPPLIGAEDDDAFARRVQLAVDAVLDQTEPDTTVAVVSHGGTLNQMLKNWLNISRMGRLTFSFSNSSLTIVDVYATYIRLNLLNDTSHLGVAHADRSTAYTQGRYPR
ncbi:MAG: histidine phosphatase family protein [Anaerolineae bacterium]